MRLEDEELIERVRTSRLLGVVKDSQSRYAGVALGMVISSSRVGVIT